MQITINIKDENIAEKIVWLLHSFKDKGVEIVTNMQDNSTQNSSSSKILDELNELINTKSKDATKVDFETILNPHKELSSDIS